MTKRAKMLLIASATVLILGMTYAAVVIVLLDDGEPWTTWSRFHALSATLMSVVGSGWTASMIARKMGRGKALEGQARLAEHRKKYPQRIQPGDLED